MTWLTFFARETGQQLTHLRYEIVWHSFPFKRCFCLFSASLRKRHSFCETWPVGQGQACFKLKKNDLATVWVGKTIPRESAKGSLHHRGLPMHKRTLNADVTRWKHPGCFNSDSQTFPISWLESNPGIWQIVDDLQFECPAGLSSIHQGRRNRTEKH